jgi:hypothetical protein
LAPYLAALIVSVFICVPKYLSWGDRLENSFDPARTKRIHFIAELKDAGEIHRFLCVRYENKDRRTTVKRVIDGLAEFKLFDCDPLNTKIIGIKWV